MQSGLRLRSLWPEGFTEVSRAWPEADAYYQLLRARLEQSNHWRFGPRRQPMELRVLRELADAYVSFDGIHFLDIGCGVHHPFGISTLAIALGAASSFATDVEGLLDERRAAQATADLIAFLLLDPVAALGEPSPSAEAICRRIHDVYDTRALLEGKLFGAVKRGLEYKAASFFDISLPPDHFGLSQSHTVLEHIHDLPGFMRKLFAATRPGGYSFHHVDNQDHRMYWNGVKYKAWSFLLREELDDESRGDALKLCSRLRYSDHLRTYRETGFEIVTVSPRRSSIPRDVVSRFEERFQRLSDDDLDIAKFTVLLRKPQEPLRA
jgi:SAM-dependent methyltransferase